MKHLLPSSSRAVTVLALLALFVANACFAQGATTPPAAPVENAAAPPSQGRPDKAVQRIRTEDAGSRIDEVRVGGETQSITVQPKTGGKMPEYEVRPSDGTRGSAPSSSSTDTNGARVWNVLKF
ncbi:MAG: hypothetical protein JWQ72_100 [Polaromonas sp.]|nr:hypothetical protein [Polaromonas sp.]